MKRSAEGGGLVARALSAPCANKPGLRFLGYIAAPTAPFDLPPCSPARARPHVYAGCTPNDIIVITHYLTSEATLQMILGSRARSAFHYGAAQTLPRPRQQQRNGSAISDAICCSAREFEST